MSYKTLLLEAQHESTRIKLYSRHHTHTFLFDLYDESYTMDLEDFNTACKIPQWGIHSEPHKSEYNDFLASITMGELEIPHKPP